MSFSVNRRLTLMVRYVIDELSPVVRNSRLDLLGAQTPDFVTSFHAAVASLAPVM